MIDKKILLVEDGEYKKKSVVSYLKNELGCESIDIESSYSSAVKALVNKDYDLAIIDMSLPTFDQSQSDISGDFRALAGLDIARQIERRKVQIKFVFLTQYQSLSTEEDSLDLLEITKIATDLYHDKFKGAIYYEHSGSKWKEGIKEFVLGE